MLRSLLFVLACIVLSAGPAGAACTSPSPVGSISGLVGTTIHVIPTDQNCAPVAPANLTCVWNSATPAIATETTDAAGFSFAITAIGSNQWNCLEKDGGGAFGNLVVNGLSPVTAIKFLLQ